MEKEHINQLSFDLIGAAIEVHRVLGPGLLESVYEQAFSQELKLREIPHVRQKSIPVSYKGLMLDADYRIDVVVAENVVVELKSVEKLQPVFCAQVLTYLKLGNYPLGLLINFNSARLADGIERIANHAPDLSAASRLRVKEGNVS